MNKVNIFSIKTLTIALTMASLSTSANVQAHDNDYLPLVPFILYNVLAQPRHNHSHHYRQHDHRQSPRRYSRHSQSTDGYSQKRLIKKHRRH